MNPESAALATTVDPGHLTLLIVVLPILVSVIPLIASLRDVSAGWVTAAAALAVNLALTVALAASLFLTGDRLIRYEIGGIPVPHGIELVADGLSILVVLLVSLVAFTVLIYTRTQGPRGNAFYSAYLLLTGGLLGVSLTGDLFNLYVFLEITGLAAYALVASGDTGRGAYAALKYMLVGTVGASLYLIGVGYAFLATGTLNMADLERQLSAVGYGDPLVITAFAFLVMGLAVKAALYPVHTWQPDAYSSAPTGVAAYVSALVSTVAVYALARVVLSVYTVDFLDHHGDLQALVIYFAAVSIVAGSVLAVYQSDVKRMLAYSSVSQFGLIVAAFAIANPNAVYGGLLQLIGHGVAKGALFVGAGVFAVAYGARKVEDYEGIAHRSPYAAAAFAVLAFTLVGAPPTVGFMGKWYVGVGAVESGFLAVAAVIFFSTLLTLAYVVRLVDRMYFGRPTRNPLLADGGGDDAGDGQGVTHGILVVLAVAAVVGFLMGPFASEIQALVQPTMEALT